MTEAKTQKIIELLKTSYQMELETVCNYLANSIHLDGIRAKEIKESLGADITEELGHAKRLAMRIHVLDGRVPGSLDLQFAQSALQPPEDPFDILSIIKGVIAAEEGAIEQYQKIIEATDGVDPVTQDLAVELKGDEEEHKREFMGFLREAELMFNRHGDAKAGAR